MQKKSTSQIWFSCPPLFKLTLSLALLAVTLLAPGITFADEVRIALRAHTGIEPSMKNWQATIDFLNKKIPEHHFTLHPFENISGLNQAVSRKEYDFCINNPASFINQKINYGIQPLATLVNKRQGNGYTQFGSVIFTRSDRTDINKLQDLKNKSFIAVDELAFGGWRVAWDELLKNNINPFSDFKSMSFAGGAQQNVVFSVLNGDNDAGSVRTDMLERLAAAGKINLQDFKVISGKTNKDFPFLHSTDLYPEWVFSTARLVSSKLKTQVTAALFSIQSDSTAALNGHYIGWISPLDYSPVEKLLQKLHIGPYNVATMNAFDRLKSQYATPLFILSIVFILLTLIMLYVVRQNKRILRAKQLLQKETISRQTLERQLMHIQKMESLGQLTGGIAHDFNNMLASILGYTELSMALETVNKDSKLKKYLSQVLATGDRAKLLVNQMLAFSRTEGETNRTEILLVSSLIEDAKKLLRPLLPSNISFNIEENTENLYVKVNRVMLDQVLMNICLNAKDATSGLAGSGAISISTHISNYDLIECNSCHQNISDTYVVIEIKDNGIGMDSDCKKRLFEPFFTTKDVDKGTGMGLSMVHGILHEHNGHIIVDSILNKGTCIKILLPESTGIHLAQDSKETKHSKIPEKNKDRNHILIIDDEVSITTFLADLLQQYNYKVTTFNNSQQAFDFFKNNHKEISLVVTDQMMPDLTGAQLSSKILEVSQDTPIIICTGYSEDVTKLNSLNLGISAYLEKPIEKDKLLNTISSLV